MNKKVSTFLEDYVKLEYTPIGICPRQIIVLVDKKGIVLDVQFKGGCDGNLKALGKLVKNQPAESIIKLLESNTCGNKPTSCAAEMCKALKFALEDIEDMYDPVKGFI